MLHRSLPRKLLFAGVLFLCGLAVDTVEAADYTLDPAHTFITFRTSHIGFGTLIGRFNKFEGSFSWDKDNPTSASVNFSVQTASVDSNWAERDKHLRGEEFLDADKYPEATFRSTGYSGNANEGTMQGILTLRGVSKPVSLKVQHLGEGQDPWGGYRVGFRATTTIKRSEFGHPMNLGPQSDVVQLDLFMEGVRK